MTAAIDHSIQALRARCQRRQWMAQSANLLHLFSQAAWPGLAFLLAAGVLFEQLHWPLSIVFAAITIWFITSMWWAARHSARWRIPNWRPIAWLDKQTQSRGTLLAAYEQGVMPHDGLPNTRNVKFPTLLQANFFIGWAFIIAAYLAWWWMPPPATPFSETPQTYTPQPVQNIAEALELLKKHRPPEDTFAETVEQALTRLQQRKGAMEQADLHALKQLENQTSQQLSNDLENLQRTQASIEQFEQMLAQAENISKAALSEQIQALENALKNNPGLSPEQLQSLIQQMQVLREAAAQQQSSSAAQSFDAEQIKKLQEQIQQYREQLAQEQKSTRQVLQKLSEGNTITRGPGHQPLNYSHLTFQRRNTNFDSTTFKGNTDTETVLLGKGLTKRSETGQLDAPVSPPPTFESGSKTLYRQKQVLPRHRETLEKYFDQLDSVSTQ